MRKHNLHSVFEYAVKARNKKEPAYIVRWDYYRVIQPVVKVMHTYCECCGRHLPVNYDQGMGHKCKSGNCSCR